MVLQGFGDRLRRYVDDIDGVGHHDARRQLLLTFFQDTYGVSLGDWHIEQAMATFRGWADAVLGALVLEVKSNLTSNSAFKAANHLHDLAPLLSEFDGAHERFKEFLPENFFCFSVFFNLLKREEYNKTAVVNMFPVEGLRGFAGAMILRGEGLPEQVAGRVSLLISDTSIPTTVERKKESLLSGAPILSLGELDNGKHLGAMVMWTEAAFSMFGFDLIAMLSGTYQQGMLSSFYGMNWVNPDR